MRPRTYLALSAAAGLLLAPSVVQAQVAVNGGGSTLAADLYKGSPDSILRPNFSYAAVGSGKGKAAFLTNDGSIFYVDGNVHFAGSDSVLSGSDATVPTAGSERAIYNATYNVAGDPNRYGPLLQFPFALAPIAIPFNKAGAALNISDANLCGIFAGQITDWSQVAGSGRTGALRVVYRNESSGTSELLTRYLTTVCPLQPGLDLTSTSLKEGKFSVQPTFKNLFVGNVAPGTFDAAPAAGGTSLYNTVNAVQGRIGYVGPDVIPDLGDATKVAKLRNYSPNEVNEYLTVDRPPPSTAADLANPAKWVPVFPNAAVGYPIVGYTNLLIGQCYKYSPLTAQLRAFLSIHYSVGATGTNDAAVRAHGFIPLTQVWREAIRNNLVLATSVNGLGNSSTCGVSPNNIGRPL